MNRRFTLHVPIRSVTLPCRSYAGDLGDVSSLSDQRHAVIVQLERLPAQRKHAVPPRCIADGCTSTATWYLVDRDRAAAAIASIGEVPCCAEHIPAAYALLRGAALVERAARRAVPPPQTRRGGDRRRPVPLTGVPVVRGELVARRSA